MDHTLEHSPNGSGHEQREVNVRTIVVSLAFLLLGAFLAAVVIIGIFRYLNASYHPEVSAREAPSQIPPEPRLEVIPSQQLKDLRAHEDHVLGTYSWVDQKAGTVRVPIDKAIDLLAAKGLPSHDYLGDILAGRKPPMPPPPPAAPKTPANGNQVRK